MTDTSADHGKWSMVGKDPWTMPIEKIDLSHPGIWQADEFLPFKERLRLEDPVHQRRSDALDVHHTLYLKTLTSDSGLNYFAPVLL